MAASRPALDVALLVALLALAAGCGSPEATRVRGGGPGADPGNIGEVVQTHDGSQPYYATPCLGDVGPACAGPASTTTASRSGSR